MNGRIVVMNEDRGWFVFGQLVGACDFLVEACCQILCVIHGDSDRECGCTILNSAYPQNC